MNPQGQTFIPPAPSGTPPTPTPGPQIQPGALTPAQGQTPAGNNQPATPEVVDKKAKTSAQNTLLISEIRDSIVVLKDGSFRAIVTCQSINFDLMSDTEREAVEYSFQNFLNSLNVPTQILVRSERVDIGPYITKLTKTRQENDNMLLGVLMDDYINFITSVSEDANIMDKSFFIIIPYFTGATKDQVIQKSKGMFQDLFGKKGPEITKIDRATYEKAIDELNNRCNNVISGLMQVGIRSARLNSQQLSTLYYNFNNPDTALREPLVDFSRLATLYVKKGEKPTNG
jgi:type IV secretory pathway VirB4 component